MNLSERQQRILADMGIPLWARRTGQTAERPVDIDAPISPATPAKDESIELMTELVVVMADTDLNAEQERLFNAMLKVIALTREQVSLIDVDSFSHLDSDALRGKSILLLGLAVAEKMLPEADLHQPRIEEADKVRRIACFSLDDMLQQPLLKASAWQALQQIAKVF